MTATAGINDELIEYLYAMLRDTPMEPGVPTWFMSEEWFCEVRRLADKAGHLLWQPMPNVSGPKFLLGYPIEVSADAGAPRIRFIK